LDDDDDKFVREGCVLDAKEMALRREGSLKMAALLTEASSCDSLQCVLGLEDKIRAQKLKLRQERHTRNLVCAAKQPGIAVVGTHPVPTQKKKKSKQRACCALIVEGLCLDFSPKVTLDEARDACRQLRDRYDIDTPTFFVGRKCKTVGSVAFCRGAASSLFHGNVLYFAPVTKSRAREHCHENQGKLLVSPKKNWKVQLTQEAKEVALGELEGYKQFSLLLGSALGVSPNDGTVR